MSRCVVARPPAEIIRSLAPKDAFSPGTRGTVTLNRIGLEKSDCVRNVIMQLLELVAWISRTKGETSSMKSGLSVANIGTVAV
jgi:hypothetical protein